MKLARLQQELRKRKLKGCLLNSYDPNFQYYVQEYLMSGALFIPDKGKPTIFVHPLEKIKHKFNVKTKDDFKKFFKKRIKVGYNPSFTSARRYFSLRTKFKLQDIEETLEEIRTIKTEKEIQYLKKAAAIADKIMQSFIKNFNFKTEREAKNFLKTEMAKFGVEQSFEPIVASEKGAATPHYFSEKKIKKGFLIVDMGVKWKGYCSDITRTFYIGKPSKQEKEIYNKVLKVQKDCIKMCKPNVKCSKVSKHALNELGDKFIHGLGHGIGLKIHELPNLKPKSNDVFKNNMVFTVEPGYYDEKKKIGIRIEDDVLLKNGKPILLTKTKKELICF